MVRSLCAFALVFFCAVARGSKDGSHRNVVDLAERSKIDTRCVSSDSCSHGSYGSSYSPDTVLGGYNNLLPQVRSCQSALEAGQISVESAIQQVQQLATQFQSALSQFQDCSACHTSSDLNTFGSVFTDVFSSFDSLFFSCQKSFPDHWTSILSGPFSSLDTSLAGFMNVCQSNGLPVNTFIPQSFGSFLGPVGLTSARTTLQGFGYSF